MAGIIKRVRLDGPDRGAGKVDMLPRSVRHRIEDAIDDVSAASPCLPPCGAPPCRAFARSARHPLLWHAMVAPGSAEACSDKRLAFCAQHDHGHRAAVSQH